MVTKQWLILYIIQIANGDRIGYLVLYTTLVNATKITNTIASCLYIVRLNLAALLMSAHLLLPSIPNNQKSPNPRNHRRLTFHSRKFLTRSLTRKASIASPSKLNYSVNPWRRHLKKETLPSRRWTLNCLTTSRWVVALLPQECRNWQWTCSTWTTVISLMCACFVSHVCHKSGR